MIYQRIKKTISAVQSLTNHRSIRNVFWNLIGGLFTGGLVVIVTPWYVHHLGMEGYGILSLWLMMQIILGLLDFGIGGTIIKEFASSNHSNIDIEFQRDLLRTVETIYWSIAVALVVLLYFAAGAFGIYWLKVTKLTTNELVQILSLMAITLGLQFPNSIYSNALIGLQEHRKMNIIQIGGNILRHGGGVLILLWRNDLFWFFCYQLMVAILQTFLSRVIVWTMLSGSDLRKPIFKFFILKDLWKFSAGMAITSFVAIMLSNADRIILSKIVPTSELGKYAIAFTATGLLQFGIQPFYRAFFPRYAELISLGDYESLKKEYFKSCQIMAIVIIPLGIIGWGFAPQLFQFWIGYNDPTIVRVFRLLIIGITCSGLMWLPAAYQQAHGWTSLHIYMMGGALILGIPVAVWSVSKYGTAGATVIWLLHGISDITIGLWLMHKRLLVGQFLEWYLHVLALPLIISIAIITISNFLMPAHQNNWLNISWIAVTGIITIGVTLYFDSRRLKKK
ncbi:lipopolysaccharide biosynthesis protein [Pedobacter heparinus]|uniref:lipopolysaccharide biosynthesis protein n=1 Tax=Pedobacter heparinus TaxID=984 RepID=UPI00293164CF|nr:oligosaccharide flippase family protein [Pedobacter heparinus]